MLCRSRASADVVSSMVPSLGVRSVVGEADDVVAAVLSSGRSPVEFRSCRGVGYPELAPSMPLSVWSAQRICLPSRLVGYQIRGARCRRKFLDLSRFEICWKTSGDGNVNCGGLCTGGSAPDCESRRHRGQCSWQPAYDGLAPPRIFPSTPPHRPWAPHHRSTLTSPHTCPPVIQAPPRLANPPPIAYAACVAPGIQDIHLFFIR